MRGLLKIVIAACVATAMATGCVETLNNRDFHVVCHIDEQLRPDSVTLMILEQQYNQLKMIATTSADSATGDFVFEGQIENPTVAFFKFSNDSTPFYFVIEPGETVALIGASGVTITSGELNHCYFSFLKHRNEIMAARKLLRDQYIKILSPDSMVNIEDERQLAMQDSVLADSLDNITVEMIMQGSPVSLIVKERFVNSLPPAKLAKINSATMHD